DSGAAPLQLGQGADQAPQLLLGLFADAAGIDDDQVGGLMVVGPAIPVGPENFLDPLGIVDVHLTTEGLDRIVRHGEGSCVSARNDSVTPPRWPPPLSCH